MNKTTLNEGLLVITEGRLSVLFGRLRPSLTPAVTHTLALLPSTTKPVLPPTYYLPTPT